MIVRVLAVRAVHTSILASLAALAAGCGASHDGHEAERDGVATIALTQVPADVKCVEIDATGSSYVTRRFDVSSGQSSVLTLDGLPIGGVDFTGSAFSAPCANVGAPATWVTDPASATLSAGTVADVTLTFHRDGRASVGADFQDASFRNVTTLAGTAGQQGSTDGVGAAARLGRPHFMTTDGTTLYVTDGRNNTIRAITLATAAVTTLAGTENVAGGSADGVGPAASFNGPMGIASEGGALYVADFLSNTIRKIDVASKSVTTIAGAAGQAGSVDGIGTAARFNQPYGLTSDGKGNLYVADTQNAVVRKIALATGAVTTFAGSAGQTGSLDGVGAAARFSGPAGLASDGTSLYAADSFTLRQIDLATATVSTIAGDPTTGGAADGYNARFQGLTGVAHDGKHTLFLSDVQNDNIRQYDLDTGLVTSIAGSAAQPGHADGFGPAARFSIPIGITTDPAGNVYVADTSNHTIRKM